MFSRDLRPLEEFPELLAAARKLDGDFILDGELIAFAEGRKLGFADLQKRLGRKTADGDLFLSEPGANTECHCASSPSTCSRTTAQTCWREIRQTAG